MIAPAIETFGSPALDHEPRCGTSWHEGPPRAHYWVDAHGCVESLMCRTCLVLLTAMGRYRCTLCQRRFPSWSASVKVVPL